MSMQLWKWQSNNFINCSCSTTCKLHAVIKNNLICMEDSLSRGFVLFTLFKRLSFC